LYYVGLDAKKELSPEFGTHLPKTLDDTDEARVTKAVL
jgi:hypothetical protein